MKLFLIHGMSIAAILEVWHRCKHKLRAEMPERNILLDGTSKIDTFFQYKVSMKLLKNTVGSPDCLVCNWDALTNLLS